MHSFAMQQTAKPPEEGMIWEWRAFGRIDPRLAAKVEEHPIRLGIEHQLEEDTYLVSPRNDQNVKLRNYQGESVLKIKLLFATGPNSIELYNESAKYIYRFPVSRRELQETARLLQVRLGDFSQTLERFTPDQFVEALAESSPPVIKVDVQKTRTQYEFDGGWMEMADVLFPQGRVQTISIQSPELETVREILKHLRPGKKLEVMNYIEACRRWG